MDQGERIGKKEDFFLKFYRPSFFKDVALSFYFSVFVVMLIGALITLAIIYSISWYARDMSFSEAVRGKITEKPNSHNKPASWITYIDEQYGLKFKYPKNFGANVWRPQFWPPKAEIISVDQDLFQIGCPDIPSDSQATETTIDGIDYLLFRGDSAGAGSLYSGYCYVARKEQNNYVLYFLVRSTLGCGDGNCGPYCETEFEDECANFNKLSDIEKPIEEIVSSFKF